MCVQIYIHQHTCMSVNQAYEKAEAMSEMMEELDGIALQIALAEADAQHRQTHAAAADAAVASARERLEQRDVEGARAAGVEACLLYRQGRHTRMHQLEVSA